MTHRALALLERQHASGVRPHAYLLWGNDEVKKEEALKYIMSPYVGDHPSANPNIFEIGIREGEKSISIDDIRHARARAMETPFAVSSGEAKNIIIIRSLDAVTIQGASALLKILEEPPESTLFIGMTGHVYGVLPTLRSRFSSFRFYTRQAIEAGASHDVARAADDMKRIAEKGGIEEFIGKRINALEYKIRSGLNGGNMKAQVEACERLLEAYRAVLINPTINKRLSGEYAALLS
jgi:DNA polymerase III delta prime subunit